MSKPSDYCEAWHAGTIQREIYARAGWCCEHCGMAFTEGTTQAKTARRPKDGKPYVLTCHHISGVKSDYSYENLLAACQMCHLRIQATWKPGGVIPASWGGVPLWVTRRGLAYEVSGQLEMFA